MKSRIFRSKIKAMIDEYEDKIVKYYIENGPDKLRGKLDIACDEVWNIFYNHLLFDKDVVKKLVKSNTDYIQEVFEEHGPDTLRHAFGLMGAAYDDVWEYIMDYVGISRGALCEYVSKNSGKYQKMISNGKATGIRVELGLSKNKYLHVWEEALDILLECVSVKNYSYSNWQQGIRLFTQFYNTGREHRPLNTKSMREADVTQESA